jgi:isochorismate synthase
MSPEVTKLISGGIFGYHVTLPQSLGSKVLSGHWDENNFVQPFDSNAEEGKVGGKCLNHADYLKLVDKAKSAMQVNHWKKIVTSRCFEWQNRKWNFETYIQQLRLRFPETFLVIINHPIWGRWIAASPELLLKKRGDQIETMALAGTLAADSSADWGRKEIAEHEVVRDMIVKTLMDYGVEEIKVHPQNELYFKTVKHLQTRIAGLYKGDVQRLVQSLSPTPALAGMPVQPVMKWIVENEQYQRGLYGGIVSVQNQEENYAIVLLRCLYLKEEGALGFVGGGVMSDSDAEIEWSETVMKQNAFIFAEDENIQ